MEGYQHIQEKLDIKILILFILRRLPGVVDPITLANLALGDDHVGYFEYAECLAELVDGGHVTQSRAGYEITEKGDRNCEIVETSLPYTIRSRLEKKLTPLAESMRRRAMIETGHEQDADGVFHIRLKLSDGMGEIASLRLLCGSEEQAGKIEENFRASAELYYNKIFVINPGSTSTKLALFENDEKLYETNVFHDATELLRYPSVNAQLPYRWKVIRDFLKEDNIDLSDVDAIVGRGGSCAPVSSGVYEVNDLLVSDTAACKSGMEHPSNLGVQLAREMQREYGGRAFMVDPTCVDELCDMARMTGIKGVNRHTNMHTLNMRGVAMHHAKKVEGRPYKDCRFIVCHIDGGISISAHEEGRIIDCNNSGGGEGPYSPTRIGTVSAADLIDYCKGKDLDEVRKMTIRSGGFVSHFGTSSSDTVHARMDAGDKAAARVWKGMLYQIDKTVGAMAAVLCGRVDAILLTGGLLRFPDVEADIRAHCGWIAPIYSYPGEVEHEAMAAGALRVLRGEEEAKEYTGVPVWNGWED